MERQLVGVCTMCGEKEKCLKVCNQKKDEVLNKTKELLEENKVTDPESLEKLIDRVWALDWKYNYIPDAESYGARWRKKEEFYVQKNKISRRLKDPNKAALDGLEFYYRTLKDFAARKMTAEHDISTLCICFGPYSKNQCRWLTYEEVFSWFDARQILRWIYEQVQDTHYFTNEGPHSWLYGKWVKGRKPPYDWHKKDEYWCGERRDPDGTIIREKSEGLITK